jgi:ABC-type branched-subunit amino acid transport system substrate-binding protein
MAQLTWWPKLSGVCLVATLGGCDVFDADLERRILDGGESTGPRECEQHPDCADRGEGVACTPDGRCVALANEHCEPVVGELGANAIVLGSLFSLTGAQAQTNLPRAQSAALAIEEINEVGGVPGTGSAKRPLVLVQCDEVADLDSAATHLIKELKVPAIVGPNVSQDVITVTNEYSVEGGTVLITPTGVASSIGDLEDNNLTWQMIPTDVQRAPLMKDQIIELETQLREERSDRDLRLSIVFRDDALGTGTRVALNDLTFNGMSLTDNLSPNVKAVTLEPYGATDDVRQAEIVTRQLAFEPDIIVMAGLAEAINNVMAPIEEKWTGKDRPYYVLIDSLKVPELLALAKSNEALRRRVRGTGIVPTARSSAVFDAFSVDYQTRYPGSSTSISGMGPSYDAAYSIALALAATREMPVSGASVAQGLTMLAGPGNGSPTPLQSTTVLSAFSQLTTLKSVLAIGTFAPVDFDERGAPASGRVEIWCIAGGMSPQYTGSGRTYDIETKRLEGAYEQCEAD